VTPVDPLFHGDAVNRVVSFDSHLRWVLLSVCIGFGSRQGMRLVSITLGFPYGLVTFTSSCGCSYQELICASVTLGYPHGLV
jgi:hypothetical protein